MTDRLVSVDDNFDLPAPVAARQAERLGDATTPEGATLARTYTPKPAPGKWVTYGDSITAANGYQPHVIARLGLDAYTNRGVSGRAMADGTANGVGTVTTIVGNMDHATFTLVTIAAGTNDFKLNVPLGTLGGIADTTFNRNTFYGAYRHALGHLLTNSPLSRVVLCTPLKRNNDGYTDESRNAAGHQLRDYVAAIRQIGEMYGLPVCDSYSGSGFNAFTLGRYTSDGLHPNDLGHKRLGRFMGDYIASILGEWEPLAMPDGSTPPSTVTNLRTTARTATTATLTWAAATGPSGVAGYEYSVDQATFYTPTGTTAATYTLKGLGESGLTASIRAYDAAGNRGASSTVAVAAYAPPAPTVALYRASNLNETVGTKVTAWPDSGTSGISMTSPDAGPTLRNNGTFKYLEFNGVADTMTRSKSAQPKTRFIVARIPDYTSGPRLIIGSTFQGGELLGAASTGEWIVNSGSVLYGPKADNGWHVFSMVLNGVNSKLKLDKGPAATGSIGTLSSGSMSFGVNADTLYQKVDIAEFYETSQILTDAEINAKAADLMAAYGIS